MPPKKGKKKPVKEPTPRKIFRPQPPFPGDAKLVEDPPYPRPPQPGEIGWKYDYQADIEAPYELLGGLNLLNRVQMRRVMAMIQDPASLETTVKDSKYSAKRLHRWERAIVNRIVSETKGDYLLYRILRWFGSHWNKTDQEVEDAINAILQKATIYVRRRETFEREYLEAKDDWKEFVGSSWEASEDLEDPEVGTEGVNLADHRDPDYQERLQRRISTFHYEYFQLERYKDDPSYVTEQDTEDEIGKGKKKKTKAKKPPKPVDQEPRGRTRSGKVKVEEVWQDERDFPGLRELLSQEPTQKEGVQNEQSDYHEMKEPVKEVASTKKGSSTSKKEPPKTNSNTTRANAKVAAEKSLLINSEDEEYTVPKRSSTRKEKSTAGRRVIVDSGDEEYAAPKQRSRRKENPIGEKMITHDSEDEKHTNTTSKRPRKRIKSVIYDSDGFGEIEDEELHGTVTKRRRGAQALLLLRASGDYVRAKNQPAVVPRLFESAAGTQHARLPVLPFREKASPLIAPQHSSTTVHDEEGCNRLPMMHQENMLTPNLAPRDHQSIALPRTQKILQHIPEDRSSFPTTGEISKSPKTLNELLQEKRADEMAKAVAHMAKFRASASIGNDQPAVQGTPDGGFDDLFNTKSLSSKQKKYNTSREAAPISHYTPAVTRQTTPSASRMTTPVPENRMRTPGSTDRLSLLNEWSEPTEKGAKRRKVSDVMSEASLSRAGSPNGGVDAGKTNSYNKRAYP